MPENIAQLEFFLVRFDNFEHIVSEVSRRAEDGKRVKLVVRIYDKRGVLTKHVRMMQKLRKHSEVFYQGPSFDFAGRPSLRRWLLTWRRRRLAAKNLDTQSKLLGLALRELRATISQHGLIGIEDYPGGPFRYVQNNELHELWETARRAASAWAFVFKPNDLLADRNSVIASAF